LRAVHGGALLQQKLGDGRLAGQYGRDERCAMQAVAVVDARAAGNQ